MKYTYTIIIPHKNSPKLLQRCIDSIPQRDDLHIIVVDDNSDADKVDFDKFPGHNRKDVEIHLTKEGKGAGYARNVGLTHADCKKVLFADADDYFNYCLNEILDEYKDDNTDIVFFNRLNVDSELYTYSKVRDWFGGNFKKYEDDPKEGEKIFRYGFDVPYCKIIQKSLIDKYDIRYEETTNQNDVRFSYMTGHYAKTIKVDNRAIYTVTYSPRSIMFTWNTEKIKTRITVNCRRVLFLKENKINIGATHCLERLLPNIKNQDAQLYEDCLTIISEQGLDADYYRKITDNLIMKKIKEEKRVNRVNNIRKLLNPIKTIIKAMA